MHNMNDYKKYDFQMQNLCSLTFILPQKFTSYVCTTLGTQRTVPHRLPAAGRQEFGMVYSCETQYFLLMTSRMWGEWLLIVLTFININLKDNNGQRQQIIEDKRLGNLRINWKQERQSMQVCICNYICINYSLEAYFPMSSLVRPLGWFHG